MGDWDLGFETMVLFTRYIIHISRDLLSADAYKFKSLMKSVKVTDAYEHTNAWMKPSSEFLGKDAKKRSDHFIRFTL